MYIIIGSLKYPKTVEKYTSFTVNITGFYLTIPTWLGGREYITFCKLLKDDLEIDKEFKRVKPTWFWGTIKFTLVSDVVKNNNTYRINVGYIK